MIGPDDIAVALVAQEPPQPLEHIQALAPRKKIESACIPRC
jgi:hypothetical protein